MRPASSSTSKATSARCATPSCRMATRWAHRHALRLRHARQPHPPGQHGGRRALDAERRDRQAHPRLGQPRLHQRRMTYDELRRPTDSFVTENGAERLAERTVYGESQGDAEANNQRGAVYQVFDGAGVVTSEATTSRAICCEASASCCADYKSDGGLAAEPVPPNDGSLHQQHDATMRSTAR